MAAPIDLGWSSGDIEDTFPMARFEFVKIQIPFFGQKACNKIRRATRSLFEAALNRQKTVR
jgi:hypothetical protein